MAKSSRKRSKFVSKTKEIARPNERSSRSRFLSMNENLGSKKIRTIGRERRKRKTSSAKERGKKFFDKMSDKRKRQSQYVKESEEKRGRSPKVAKRIGEATVNKTRKMNGETKS